MKRKHKIYSRPKKPFDKQRIEEEAKIKEEFGLKNKKEIWKAEARVRVMRNKAKNIIYLSQEEQKKFFSKLNDVGMNINSIADVLSLDKKDYLKRRLQTIVFKKKIANSIKSARQLVSHKKILVDGRVVNSPSYIVPVELEKKITLKEKGNKKTEIVLERKNDS